MNRQSLQSWYTQNWPTRFDKAGFQFRLFAWQPVTRYVGLTHGFEWIQSHFNRREAPQSQRDCATRYVSWWKLVNCCTKTTIRRLVTFCIILQRTYANTYESSLVLAEHQLLESTFCMTFCFKILCMLVFHFPCSSVTRKSSQSPYLTYRLQNDHANVQCTTKKVRLLRSVWYAADIEYICRQTFVSGLQYRSVDAQV